MAILPLGKALTRCDQYCLESDRDYFDGLMYAGELLLKLVTLAFVGCMDEDRDRARYSVLYKLVRADGIGSWVEQLTEIVQGSASSALNKAAHPYQKELITRHGDGTPQFTYVHAMRNGLREVSESFGPAEAKVQLISLFRDFAAIRNATRGHGAYDAAKLRRVADHVRPVIYGLANELEIFNTHWVHLYQNLSGKYRVTRLGEGDGGFADLRKKPPKQTLINGVYLWAEGPRHAELVEYDLEESEIYLPNGGFNGKRFELICYTTGDKDTQDARAYLAPPGQLPESETSALKDLRVMGECLTNAPDSASEYVARPGLEKELFKVLSDDRHPIVTLQGRGGIGKTSVALQVIKGFDDGTRFGQICWFSARDIDLLPHGAKRVKPDAMTIEGFAEIYCAVFQGEHIKRKEVRSVLESAMSSAVGDPTLFIFDNFETVSFPTEVYEWIDTYIRSPNKALVTTRIREFRGDWPVEVGGMEYEEAKALVASLVESLELSRAPSPTEFDLMYDQSGGHPYIIRIMMGDYAATGKLQNIAVIASARDDLLNALFERTYAQLSSGAARVFLTCAAWNSLIPVVVLEAVLLTANQEEHFEVLKAIDELKMSSLIELRKSFVDSHEFIYVPLITQNFAKSKLMLSPHRAEVEADLHLLHAFGAVNLTDHSGLSVRIDRFVREIARSDQKDANLLARQRRVLELLAASMPELWLKIARLEIEGDEVGEPSENVRNAQEAVGRFLEKTNDGGNGVDLNLVGGAWLEYLRLSERLNDEGSIVNAVLGIARSKGTGLSTLSRVASDYNRMLSAHELSVEQVAKESVTEALAEALSEAMRKEEPNAADYSRLGWLYLRLNRQSDALSEAKKGLQIDPGDEHCSRLRNRLESAE